MAAVTTLDGVNMIALAYRAKSDNVKKANAKKANFISYFFAADFVTTLPDILYKKKRHDPNGRRAPSMFIKCCKLVEVYYDGMPTYNIVNHNAQFILGIDEAVKTTSIFKIIPCYIL